jgi:uncharacterized protein
MPDKPPGTPLWVDIASPDPDATAAFYGGLFGWKSEEAGPPEETGGYRLFRKDGKIVAGHGPQQNAQQPVVWVTYISTDDADRVAAGVKQNGGQVLLEPFDVLDQGRMGVFTDPPGAAFACWQPKQNTGAELFNEPGSLTWNELATRDAEGSKPFYSAVFGWTPSDTPMGDVTYTIWNLGDRGIAGMIEMDEQWPPEIPPHWMVYFAVGDAEAAAERAKELGGTVSVPPTDLPGVGRFAVLNDTQGAFFSLMQSAPREEQ